MYTSYVACVLIQITPDPLLLSRAGFVAAMNSNGAANEAKRVTESLAGGVQGKKPTYVDRDRIM